MSFTTGQANSAADLIAAIRSACTAAGWTLAGNTLSKGNCHTSIVDTPWGTNPSYIVLQGGTDVDGSGNLVNPGPGADQMFGLPLWNTQGNSNYVEDPFGYPLQYFIHVLTNPDEVYVIANYSTDRYQWCAFGCSPVSGLPGTGGWYGASASRGQGLYGLNIGNNAGGWVYNAPAALFWSRQSYDRRNGIINHGLSNGVTGETGWSAGGIYNPVDPVADALSPIVGLIGRQPNNWNGEAILVPIQPFIARPSNKVSMVGDLRHARYVRNDFLADGEVITLGNEKWKSYPWYRKYSADRDAGYSEELNYSGTMGWAIRYDGP